MMKHKHLSIEKQSVTQAVLTLWLKTSLMAAELGSSLSTNLRQLYCNGWAKLQPRRDQGRPAIAGKYRALFKQIIADDLSAKPRIERRLQNGNRLWQALMSHLKQDYSPEQIAATLKSVNANPLQIQVAETSYSAIYLMQRGTLRTEVIGRLHFGK